MSDLLFLRRAIELAREHSAGGRGGPFGALVVCRGEVAGEGWNQVVEEADPTAHAEIKAIREAARRKGTHLLDDCVLYASCEPCPMCLAAIYWARIPRVVFAGRSEDAGAVGFDDAVIARELRLSWEERRIESRQALREEALGVLQEWKENPEREEY